MTAEVYRFQFESTVSLTEAEMSLHLAMFAVEGLFGEARVRLEMGYRLDEPGHAILVDAGTEVGAAVVKVYTGLLLREHRANAFRVCRVERSSTGAPAPAADPGNTAAVPAAV